MRDMDLIFIMKCQVSVFFKWKGLPLLHNSQAAAAAKERRDEKKALETMTINMDETRSEASPPLADLILSLEHATLMAKQLPATSDPTQLVQIFSFLQQANHNLSSFLSNTQLPPPPTQLHLAENSLSSATGAVADENGGEPMEVGDGDGDDEENSKATIDRVEERMRDCFIKNKRTKRQLSPSSLAAAEENRLCEDAFVGGANGFDPHRTKLRALDLVYQFHG